MTMRRVFVSLMLSALMSLALAGLASANHSHDLVTPGTTVEDIARGNTWRCPGQPAGHAFHEHVHLDVFGKPPGTGVAQTDNVWIVAGANTCP